MSLIERVGIKALHRLDPERAHDLSLSLLARGLVPLRGGPVTSDRLRTTVVGLDLPNPVGLAAGYDKNARVIGPLTRAGFGFIEAGAATPRAQPGNPKPRLFRLAEEEAVINRFGFNNEGAEAIAARLAARAPSPVPVGLNIGANRDSEDRAADFASVVATTGLAADFLTVNVSSPNTERLRELQGAAALESLLSGVLAARDALPVRRPVFLKIGPDLDAPALSDLAAVALNLRLDALIATNSTTAREGLPARWQAEAGGLSGRPLFERATATLAALHRLTGGRIALIGTGGIASADDAWAKLAAGASAVQVYTALVFQGLSFAPRLAEALDARLAREGYGSVAELAADAPAAA
ncbi:quinone-dependent dihydroorotate dehydrogenase [Paracoccus sp. S-4012]|uniref:quinone-dependent dihydroorotate dehydrogenase n=1 Tax=Paracoccus sp. S-4012 TaxID=2665648 RepID=UPI0012B009E6|nr:quinone-dependent dihydroorotate dehydrogenase [Paracoccus sp. S-4012]MRX51131.1 quinone-dependent dihydroorotate dehydrogenase [Paracoccus sp. S-4012]